MSHGNGEHDFDGLERLNLETAERIKQVRIEARSIIDRLEPVHIDSWADLFFKLEDSLDNARNTAMNIDPAFREKWQRELRGAELEKQQEADNSMKAPVILISICFLLLIAGSFTMLPTEIGSFFYWVVLPVVIVAVVWSVALYKAF